MNIVLYHLNSSIHNFLRAYSRKKSDWEGSREWWKFSTQKLQLSRNDLDNMLLNDYQWCMAYATKYHVVPHLTLGNLPKKYLTTWTKRKCGDYFLQKLVNEEESKLSPNQSISRQELIAVVVATTSRSASLNTQLHDLPLFKYLLPSLLTTINDDYRYLIVIGYDNGDPFFDSVIGHQKISNWFEMRLRPPQKSIEWQVRGFDNFAMKPGPIFLAVAKIAFELGADYFYRVNDDTEIVTRYAFH